MSQISYNHTFIVLCMTCLAAHGSLLQISISPLDFAVAY